MYIYMQSYMYIYTSFIFLTIKDFMYALAELVRHSLKPPSSAFFLYYIYISFLKILTLKAGMLRTEDSNGKDQESGKAETRS